jgi:S-adenosylmethionine:tRNA ribosyltransferase-isomerase
LERLSDYDYNLPDSAIAQGPLEDRAASRLLYLHKDSGLVDHRAFRDVVTLLHPGDLLVLNNTRVTAFRLFGHKPTGAKVEVLAIKQVDAARYECLLKPGKRLQPGAEIGFAAGITGRVEENLGEGQKLVKFDCDGDLTVALQVASLVPLPPYVHDALQDPERYQTVYAKVGGSAAAPTAGLHFTSEILEKLTTKGVNTAWVTLDVGIDTFRPVMVDDPAEHPIHGEVCEVPEETAKAVENCRGRIIAVGTTSVRTLEAFALGPRRLAFGRKDTKIFIRPGYMFKIIDGMFTNFHMPRTTMLMMISALAGRAPIMNAYDDALQAGYRFLSFGDSMFIA